MTTEEMKALKNILDGPPFHVRPRLQQFVESTHIERVPATRTSAQNRALHLFFKLLATELNDGGHTVQLVIKQKLDVDWTEQLIKEILWRPAQIAVLGKTSTKDLSKSSDLERIYDHLNRHIGEKFGVHVPFPNDELKHLENNQGYKTGGKLSDPYPEYSGPPTI